MKIKTIIISATLIILILTTTSCLKTNESNTETRSETGIIYTMDKNTGLSIFTTDYKTTLEMIAKNEYPGIKSYASDNGYLYILYDSKIEIFNNNTKISELTLQATNSEKIEYNADRLCVTTSEKIILIDIKNRTNPVINSTIDKKGEADLEGDYLYTYTEDGITIYDIKNLTSPVLKSTTKITYTEQSQLTAEGSYIYIADGKNLRIAEIKTPPQTLNLNVYNFECTQVHVDKNYIYMIQSIQNKNYQNNNKEPQEYSKLKVIKRNERGYEEVCESEFNRNITSIYTHDTNIYLGTGADGIEYWKIDETKKIQPVKSYVNLRSINYIAADEKYIYTIDERSFKFAEKSTPEKLTPVYYEYEMLKDFIVRGNLAYIIIEGTGVTILDITNIYHPITLSTIQIPDIENTITVKNNIMIIADLYRGIYLIDISDPKKPVTINRFGEHMADLYWYPFYYYSLHNIAYENNRIYNAIEFTCTIYNAENPADLKPISSTYYKTGNPSNNYGTLSVAVSGNYLYTLGGSADIVVYDITTESSPTQIYAYASGYCRFYRINTKIEGNGLYTIDTARNRMIAYDITNRQKPEEAYIFEGTNDYYIDGNIMYTAERENGFKIYNIENIKKPQLLKQIKIPNITKITGP